LEGILARDLAAALGEWPLVAAAAATAQARPPKSPRVMVARGGGYRHPTDWLR
jgi:hypothetical protein